MNFFNNLSFKHRILLGNFFVGLLPLLVSILCFMQVFVASVEKHSKDRGSQQIYEIDAQFSNYLMECCDITDLIANDSLIQEALLNSNYKDENEVYLELYKLTEGIRSGASVSVYDASGRIRWGTSRTLKTSNLPLRWGVLRKAYENEGMVLYDEIQDQKSGNNTLLSLAKTIKNPKGVIGYVVVEIKTEGFNNLFSNIVMQGETLVLADQFWSPIYVSNNTYLTQSTLKSFTKNFSHENNLMVLKEKNMISFLKENKDYSYHILLTIPAGITNEALNLMKVIGILGFTTAITLCGAISLLLSKSLTKPLNELKKAIKEVEKGHLDTEIAINRRDEFGELLERFNQMSKNLKIYTEKLVERQKEISEIKIRLLQAQLKPHFLYNSLDAIKWMAKMNRIESVVDIANDLAQILRCSISDNQFIPLSRELDVVESYIAIQKIRFSGSFKHSINVREDLLDIEVPKLILQPLVENSITHGLRDKTDGKISIIGNMDGENLLITVKDNGCGMESELVAKYNNADFDKDEGHFGIYNINNILKLYYGQNYGIHINSEVGIGTEVTIVLPAKRSEKRLG
ncbi:sensor histidine kinase [Tepidanaerobacter syntrophicus]|uniref:sensor histidine kinase n=1 Tax=Tepidanaerobacter syntrophicus TaxID=224999 RepID=UPI0024916ACA|nr:sensor histidine kinase [Tepidanaerobacter syntrophicus]